MSDDQRYPIGQFTTPEVVSPAQIKSWIDDIESLPSDLRSVVEPLTPEQMEISYRSGGWCTRQVVHHLSDSHMNSFIRFKLALTEPCPTIRPYFEDRWAELADYSEVPVAVSLQLLEALHQRWVGLLRGLSPSELRREFVHPDSGTIRLDVNIGIYSWHGRHHLAHITGLIEREGWGS